MDGATPRPSALEVGHPVRSEIGHAVVGAILVATGFFVFAWVAKEVPALYEHEPWQDDPYDAMVSAALWCVPLLVGICGVRVALCRRFASLPARRALDVLGVSRVLVGVVVLTFAGDWISVVVGAHRREWTATTSALVGLLAVLSVLAVAVARMVRGARRELLRQTDSSTHPDWLADAVALAERATGRLGPLGAVGLRAVRAADRHVVARVRRHPLGAAAAFSVAFGAAIDTPQVILEGYGPGLALLFFTISACGVFAFLVIANTQLGLIARRRRPSKTVVALVLATASVPFSASFRGSLWWVVGATDRDAGVGRFALLLLVFAVAVAALTLVVEPLVRARDRETSRVR